MRILKYPLTLILREPLFSNAHIKKRSSTNHGRKFSSKIICKAVVPIKKKKQSPYTALFTKNCFDIVLVIKSWGLWEHSPILNVRSQTQMKMISAFPDRRFCDVKQLFVNRPISTNTRCSGTWSSLSDKELLLTEYLDEQTGDCFPLPLKVSSVWRRTVSELTKKARQSKPVEATNRKLHGLNITYLAWIRHHWSVHQD